MQEVLRERRLPSGQAAKSVSNLFTGIGKCGQCGSSRAKSSKGSGKYGYVYLRCWSKRFKGTACSSGSWRYEKIEKLILESLIEVKYADLFPKLSTALDASRQRLEAEQREKGAALEETDRQLEGATMALIDRPDSKALGEKLDGLERAKGELEADLERVEADLDAVRRQSEEAEGDHEGTLAEVRAWLAEAKEDREASAERKAKLN